MPTIAFRTDDEVDGPDFGRRDRSQVIREAILAAWRLRQDELVRAEAKAVAADPEDVAEARSVLADVGSLRPGQ